MNYKIIQAASIVELQRQVNEALDQGHWLLLGGPFIYVLAPVDGVSAFCQALRTHQVGA